MITLSEDKSTSTATLNVKKSKRPFRMPVIMRVERSSFSQPRIKTDRNG